VPAPYSRLVSDLRARILSGELEPGDRLPSTRSLSARWGISRATVGKALDVLEAEGLIRSTARTGSFVRAPEDSTLRALVARVDAMERRLREVERRLGDERP
jgi:DNA-binding GntR family transcriptional regulator